MESKLFVVKKINTKTNVTTEVCNPVVLTEANRIWNDKTSNGQQLTTPGTGDYYYRVDPSESELLFG